MFCASFSILLLLVGSFLMGTNYLYKYIWSCRKPESCRVNLRKLQGIRGPQPNFVFGNIPEIKQDMVQYKRDQNDPSIEDEWSSAFASFHKWYKKYGDTFTFKLGSLHILYASNPVMVREIKHCGWLDVGKPAYLHKDRGVLLGKAGIITTNGAVWSHQRRILSPQLDKVVEMFDVIVESGSAVVKSWENLIETEGGDGKIVDITVDDDVRSFTSCIISKLVFGHEHDKGMKISERCHGLFKTMNSATTLGLPFLRYLPTEANRKAWRLAREIRSMILDIARDRNGSSTHHQDVLQVILDGSKNDDHLGPYSPEEYVVDNCKNMLVAASEGTSIAAMWGLLLLASHPEWQAHARSELEMVVLEVLRLYPPVALVSRRALQDVKICDIQVPEGVNIWTWVPALHRDPELWGPDADMFNPKRFVNGVSGACKSPDAYIPFGVGARQCPAKKLGLIQLQVLFALILSRFSLRVSPNYCHSPKLGLLLEAQHGVNLIIQKI